MTVKPFDLRRSRSASTTSGWSSAIRMRGWRLAMAKGSEGRLFGAERLLGVDPGGPPGRDDRGDDAHQAEHHDGASQGGKIGRAHSVEKPLQSMAEEQRAHQAHRHPHPGEGERAAEN